MQAASRPGPFWLAWLHAATLGMLLASLVPLLAPGVARAGFALLLYGDVGRIAAFGADAVEYVAFLHAVLGAVMVGWAGLLLAVVRGPFARGAHEGWRMLALSLGAWFVPGTAFSLWSGFWPNAILNLVFAAVFAAPLAATYRSFHLPRA